MSEVETSKVRKVIRKLPKVDMYHKEAAELWNRSRKVVQKVMGVTPRAKLPRLTAKEVTEIAAGSEIPAGRTRRGAIATQKITLTTRPKREEHAYALTKPRAIEGYVTLTQLASERGMQPQLARIWVNKAGIKKPATNGWLWKEKSKELARVRKVLGLKP